MWVVFELAEGNRLERVAAVDDGEIARTIAADHGGRTRAFEVTIARGTEFGAELEGWIAGFGASRAEAKESMLAYLDGRLTNMVARVAALSDDGIRGAMPGIRTMDGIIDRIRATAMADDLSGIVGPDDVRISRESCGPCVACGEVAATHRACMECGGRGCCPEPYCGACGVAMAGGKTAAEIADHYRRGPVSVISTLSVVLTSIHSDERDEERRWEMMGDSLRDLLTACRPIDPRLASSKYAAAMSAVAMTLHERANAITRFLARGGREG